MNCQDPRVNTTLCLAEEKHFLAEQLREKHVSQKEGKGGVERNEWIVCFDIFTKKCGNCLAPAN